MSWYMRIVLAQGVEQYLRNLGADEEIIQYILSQGENSQYLVNEFRKNPEMNRGELEFFQFPQKKVEIDPYLPVERRKAATKPELEEWILVNYRKLRLGRIPPDNNMSLINDMLGVEDSVKYWTFDAKIDEINDWYQAILPDIASYSAEQAIAASDEWHKMMVSEGEGLYYEPIEQENIVHGPTWRHEPHWQGWTIQKVTSKNDLLVEGNRLKHCVGNYYYGVKSGSITIFSLRDPSNKPMVTIEADGSGNNVDQVKGFSNAYPTEEQREMIRDWVKSSSESPSQWKEKEEGLFDMTGSLDDIVDGLINIDNGYIEEGEEEGEDYFLAEELGLDPPADPEFERWSNNLDVQELMDNIFDAMQYEYVNNDPNTVNWNEEPIVKSLLNRIKQDDVNYSKDASSYILRDILKEKIAEGEQLLRENIDPVIWQDELIQASFAKHVLNRLYEDVEGQKYFDFATGSSWYNKIVLAQGVEQFLRSLTEDEEIIQYILSQGDKMQYLVNEFKKNPGMSRADLETFQFPQKEIVDPYSDFEKSTANRYAEPMRTWVLVNLRKIRIKKETANDQITRSRTHMFYMDFIEELPQISDWWNFTQPTPQIEQFSPEEAIAAQEEWHRIAAGKGVGKEYEPTNPDSIMYGPQWQNPEWQGWTVQKVTSENDLLAEGSEAKMDHCVGEYCDDVEAGLSIIYSLRDPQNQPHITMETDDFGNIKQIMGNSNHEPKPEYKAMIKEWISTTAEDLGIVTEINAFEHMEEDWESHGLNIISYNDTMEKILQGDQDEYGLSFVLDITLDVIADSILDHADRSYSYNEGIDDSPAFLVNLAMKEDLKMERWPRHSGEWKEFRESPKESDWKNIREIREWAYEKMNAAREESGFFPEEYLDQPMPEEEDYEDPLEHQTAMKMYEGMIDDVEKEWAESNVVTKFVRYLISEMDDYIKEGMVPSPQELYEIDKKEKAAKEQKAEDDMRNSPAYHRGHERGQQMLEDRERGIQGSSNWYKKALKSER